MKSVSFGKERFVYDTTGTPRKLSTSTPWPARLNKHPACPLKGVVNMSATETRGKDVGGRDTDMRDNMGGGTFGGLNLTNNTAQVACGGTDGEIGAGDAGLVNRNLVGEKGGAQVSVEQECIGCESGVDAGPAHTFAIGCCLADDIASKRPPPFVKMPSPLSMNQRTYARAFVPGACSAGGKEMEVEETSGDGGLPEAPGYQSHLRVEWDVEETVVPGTATTGKPRLKTEDVGLTLERAVCKVLETPYIGVFKYSDTEATDLAKRLVRLPCHFTGHYTHTAKGGAPYDFTSTDGQPRYISCKSNKGKGEKVAPHTIGQASPEAFCERVGIRYIDRATLKADFQKPKITAKLLAQLEKYTFDAPIVYYNKKDDTLQLITQEQPIVWDKLDYSWTTTAAVWNNGSTLKANGTSILEVQFHSKNRNNMAVRWLFKKVLKMFPECFKIVNF